MKNEVTLEDLQTAMELLVGISTDHLSEVHVQNGLITAVTIDREGDVVRHGVHHVAIRLPGGKAEPDEPDHD